MPAFTSYAFTRWRLHWMWWQTSNCSPLLIYQLREDERLSWPGNCMEIQLCTIFVQVPLACQLPRPVTSAARIDITYYTLMRHFYYFQRTVKSCINVTSLNNTIVTSNKITILVILPHSYLYSSQLLHDYNPTAGFSKNLRTILWKSYELYTNKTNLW